ncbi:MAG: NAD-dependent epimerase/dehydratase family protein [Candidatus Hodarchaeales archaeon]|jgi:nucleoside-diphosphate-sugar epimerase
MKKVLVTGATGFIGRHTLPVLLDHDYEIHAVSSKTAELNAPGIRWHKSNLLNFNQIEALISKVCPTHLLHFAWYTIPGKFWNSLENLSWLKASIHLLQQFVYHGGQRAVLAGTCAEYNWNYIFSSETITHTDPMTLYGRCKRSMQMVLEGIAKEMGLSAAWGRIFYPYGPYEHPDRLVPYVIRSLLKGKPAECSDGNQVRDFIYVKDVAEAFVKILDSPACGAINIGSGQPVILKDLIFKIAKCLNMTDYVKLGIRKTPPEEAPYVVADICRLCSEIRWQPKYNLDQGIHNSIKWWRENLSSH